MSDFEAVLAGHIRRYPKLQPQDIVKLVYQSVFCCGHMIADDSSALERLKTEYAAVRHEGAPRIENLCECSRFYLDCWLSDRELELLGRVFLSSAKRFPAGYANVNVGGGDEASARFSERLDAARRLVSQSNLSFTIDDFDAYVRVCRDAGFPAVSHSEIYRREYSPAYRVIDSRYARLFEAIVKIDRLMRASDGIVVAAIDGRCASGKTTSAGLLAEFFEGAEVVHMDDFFLPNELRTPERLSEAGGNLHRERFIAEVADNLRRPEGFAYRVFDCSTRDYKAEPRVIPPSRLIICEGAYALHPAFGKYYDLAIFSTIDTAEQERRILARNGAAMLERFRALWIPMEERYFDAFAIKDKCELVI